MTDKQSVSTQESANKSSENYERKRTTHRLICVLLYFSLLTLIFASIIYLIVSTVVILRP